MRSAILFFIIFSLLINIISLSGENTRPDKTTSWEKGRQVGKQLKRDVLSQPGKMLYEPAVGGSSFQTFSSDTNSRLTFNAKILPKEAYELVNTFKICLTRVEQEGVLVTINDLKNNSGVFNGVISVIGDRGFGSSIGSGINLDTQSLGGSIAYYVFSYQDSTDSLIVDSVLANNVSHATGKNVIDVIGSAMCLSPSKCNVTQNAIWLNYPQILMKLENAVIAGVTSVKPDYIVSAETDQDSNCVKLNVLKPTSDYTKNNIFRCKITPDSQLPTCVSIANLESRGENFYRENNPDLLGKGEAFVLTTQEENRPFYKNEDSGLSIKSPYALVKKQAEASSLDSGTGLGKTYDCIVYNRPFGSRTTGWINIIDGTVCVQGDWDCIYKKVSELCAQYETSSNCMLLKEIRDGILTKQFNKDTGFGQTAGEVTGGSAQCWYPISKKYVPGPPDLSTPIENTTIKAFLEDINYNISLLKQPVNYGGQVFVPYDTLRPKYDPDKQEYYICGDFEVITRTYYCKETGVKECIDENGNQVPCWDENLMLSAVEAGENLNPEHIYNFETNQLTGSYKVSSIGGNSYWSVESLSKNINFMNAQAEVECPEDEKLCVVGWCADTTIYANMESSQGMGSAHKNKACYKYEKDVRQCELNDAGKAFCPITQEEISRGAKILQDCSCRSFFGEAIGYLSMLRTAAMDITCGGEHTDPVTEQLVKQDELNDKPRCVDDGEGEDVRVELYCGESQTTTSNQGNNLCIPYLSIRDEALASIKGRLYIDNNLFCHIKYIKPDGRNGETDLKFELVQPKKEWFDYCKKWLLDEKVVNSPVDSNQASACHNNNFPKSSVIESYFLFHSNENENNPPIGLCNVGSPGICKSRETGVREYSGSCGWDYWNIENIAMSYDVKPTPLSSYPDGRTPFGSIVLTFKLKREFDNRKVGLDCNNDGWLDCFDCKWRPEGYDCDGDCIADNDYTKCKSLSGWDCTDDGLEKPEFKECEYRTGGYDYNGDCHSDSQSPEECANVVGRSETVDTHLPNSCYSYNGCGTASTYSCACTRHVDYVIICDNGDTSNGSGCYGDSLINEYCYKNTIINGANCYISCSVGDYCSCSACDPGQGNPDCYETCYVCYEKVQGNEVQEGYYCSDTDAHSCSATYKENCSYVEGYDCGENGGEESNQNPDGAIDNDYTYCAKIAQGWDCNDCSPMSPAISNNDMLNDRLEKGRCSVPNNLADSNCGTEPQDKTYYNCSRYDFPMQCGVEEKNVTVKLVIQDYRDLHGDKYACRAFQNNIPVSIDKEVYDELKDYIDSEYLDRTGYPAYFTLGYDNPDTQANEVTRFITEGCRDVYNKVILEKSGTDEDLTLIDSDTGLKVDDDMIINTFIKQDMVWKYVNYGDFLYKAAEEDCQWREYLQKCYCAEVGEKTFVDMGTMTQYMFYEDLRNSESLFMEYN